MFFYLTFPDRCEVFLVFALEELQCLLNAEKTLAGKTDGPLPAFEVPGEVTWRVAVSGPSFLRVTRCVLVPLGHLRPVRRGQCLRVPSLCIWGKFVHLEGNGTSL